MVQTILYAEIYLICIIVVGFLLAWCMRSESRSLTEQWMIRLFVSTLCSFGCNFLFSLVSGELIKTSWTGNVSFILKSLYYVFFAAEVFFWCGYAEAELRTNTRKHGLLFRSLFILPFLFPIALVALNFSDGQLFTITAEGYRRGPAYHWFMAALVVCTALCSVRLLLRVRQESDPIRKRHLRFTASFPTILIVSWLLSEVGEEYPVICVCLMLEYLCMYVSSNRQQISMDKLTQVNNRQNLISFMNYKLINHESQLFLLMIDVDYFKSINDTYGHLEGDNALIRVAEALKTACMAFKMRPYIARYGGDEFIIVMEGTREEAGELCDSIRRILKETHGKEADYPLEVSIGLAKCQSGMHAGDLIAAADEELYKIKRNRKKRA